MITKQRPIQTYLIIGLVFALIIVGGYTTTIIAENNNSKRDAELYKTILLADFEFSKISIDSQKAETYYDLAGMSYEEENYKGVERNCKLAREYYSEESQGYRKIKADLNSRNLNDKLIDIYVDGLDAVIEITNSMYEACEYFESTARYYDTYYNTNVPYDDMSYDMGTGELVMMNKKIKAHDDAVEKYNQLLEDFRIELKKRLE